MAHSGILLAAMTILPVALAQTSSSQSTDQKLPWQIGSSALAGRQNNPVIFLSPEETTVVANKPTVVDIHFRVADGLHINSHVPHESTLIPTQVMVAENSGINTAAIAFPEGTDTTLDFAPRQKLSVYTGEFVLHAHMTATAGEHLWQGVMRYQACDNSECLPPRKVPFAVKIIAR